MRIILGILLLLGLVLAQGVFSQPAIQGQHRVVGPGLVDQRLSFDWLGTGSGVTSGQFSLSFPADFSVMAVACNHSRFVCPLTPSDNFTVQLVDAGGVEIGDMVDAVTVTFDVAPGIAAPQSFSVVPSMEQYFDIAAMTVAPNGSSPGTIIAGGVLLVSSGTVDIVAPLNGIASEDFTLLADATTIAVAGCELTGDAEITVSGTVPAHVNVGSSVTLTAACDAIGALFGTTYQALHSCQHDGSNTPTETVINCIVSQAPAQPDPPAGSELTLQAGPLPRGAAGNLMATFSEINNGLFGYDVFCLLTDDGGGAFTAASPLAVNVPVGGSASVTLRARSSQTDPQPRGRMVCTYSGSATGVVTVQLGIAIQPAVVPALGLWALLALMLLLLLVAHGALPARQHRP